MLVLVVVGFQHSPPNATNKTKVGNTSAEWLVQRTTRRARLFALVTSRLCVWATPIVQGMHFTNSDSYVTYTGTDTECMHHSLCCGGARGSGDSGVVVVVVVV